MAKKKSTTSSVLSQAQIQRRDEWKRLERMGLVKRVEKKRGWKLTKYQMRRVRELRPILDGDKKALPLGPKAIREARREGHKIIAGRYVAAKPSEDRVTFLERIRDERRKGGGSYGVSTPKHDLVTTVIEIATKIAREHDWSHAPPNYPNISKRIRKLDPEALRYLAKSKAKNRGQFVAYWDDYEDADEYASANPTWYH